jgi:hypothetical protein
LIFLIRFGLLLLVLRRHLSERRKHLYQAKFTSFWSSIVDTHRSDPRVLWRTVNELLQLRHHSITDKFSANHFATFFRSKVAGIRASTASAQLPGINQRNHWARGFEIGNPVGKGKKVITDLYKPLTIQININLMLKAIHSVACNNI